MREGRLVSNLLVVSVVVIQQESRQKSRGSFSFLSRCVLYFQFYAPCVGRFQIENLEFLKANKTIERSKTPVDLSKLSHELIKNA